MRCDDFLIYLEKFITFDKNIFNKHIDREERIIEERYSNTTETFLGDSYSTRFPSLPPNDRYSRKHQTYQNKQVSPTLTKFSKSQLIKSSEIKSSTLPTSLNSHNYRTSDLAVPKLIVSKAFEGVSQTPKCNKASVTTATVSTQTDLDLDLEEEFIPTSETASQCINIPKNVFHSEKQYSVGFLQTS